MTTNYEKLMKAGWDNVPEPKSLPVGHWTVELNGMYFNEAKKEGQSPRISFRHTAVAPQGDVNKAELKKLGDGYDLALNDEIYNGPQFYWGSARDQRKVIDHLNLYDVKVDSSIPLLAQADDGSYMINKEFMASMRGAKIAGKLDLEVYQNKQRNNISDFISVK